jgi:protein involved in polysaccharide export with SLBB domain
VTGAVAESGSFKYTPGMTVLHALALAQGLPSAKADVWRRLDVLREQERMRKSDERLANLQARYAVLEAESLGQPTPESAALAALIGKERAKEKIAKAVRLRELERSKLRGELAAHDQVLTALERELALLREGLQNSEKALAIRSQRVETAANLRTRGVTTDVNVALAQNDLTIAQERWNETRTAIARVERSIAQQRQEKMRAGLDEPLERERELTRVRAEMAEETVTKDVIARMLSGIPEEVSVTQDTELNILVVRRGASGVVELRADEYSPLLPGDLVKVLPRSRAISAARAGL